MSKPKPVAEAAPVAERRAIEEWARIKGLDPLSWVFAGVRPQFGSVIGAECTEVQFDAAVNAARNGALT